MTTASAFSNSALGDALSLMWDAVVNRTTHLETPLGQHGIDYNRDEDGEYATVGFILPDPSTTPVYAEIEDGTYGQLQGLRFYLNDAPSDDDVIYLKGRLCTAVRNDLIHGWKITTVQSSANDNTVEWIVYPNELPVCRECGMDGRMVETISDMLVWHHDDPRVEDQHDFEARDGRPSIVQENTRHSAINHGAQPRYLTTSEVRSFLADINR